MGGSVVLAFAAALIGGSRYWIVPAIIVPMIAVYFVFDRFLKQRESPEEQLAAEGDGG